MADALVSFVLEQMANLIQHTILDEVEMLVGVQQEVELLSAAFKDIKDVLNDAEQKQFTEKEGRLKRWIEQVRDVAYDMDDVLDEWNTEFQRSQLDRADDDDDIPAVTTTADKKKKVLSYLCTLCSCFYEMKKEVVLRHDIGSKIVEIRERLDSIKNEKRDYGLIKTKIKEGPPKHIKTTSVLLDDVSNIYSRDEEKQTILSWLFGENNNTSDPETSSLNPTIISIVGMGGLGKTTLAQLVFKDGRVKAHFEKLLWVCVSDPFDIVSVAKAIIVEAGESAPSSSDWDQELHHCLSESIEGKHFLLVLDDVWTYDQSIWERLKSSLVLGALGSRIIITTRNKGVAAHMDTTYMHHLGLLSDDGCLSILDRLLSNRNIKENIFLLEIVTKIAKKCKGLPLTAKALGGLLRFKKEEDWESLLGSNIWDLEVESVENKSIQNESLQPALLLSYYDLSSNLKECFKYCAVLPKDERINRSMMIKMWMAQGFLSSKGNKKELESVGEEYFEQLVARSLFQDLMRDDEGNIVYCKMHDLVHDFALSVSNNLESFTIDGHRKHTNLSTCSSTTRHLTVTAGYFDISDSIVPLQGNAVDKKLRTLIYFGYYSTWHKGPYISHSLRCLRVLHLQHVKSSIPDEISELIHLRFLDLSKGLMETLPETLTTLYNLQTLILSGCHKLSRLPRNMGRMINLRHIGFNFNCRSMSYLPQGIENLTSLRTLAEFVVGGGDEGCKIGGLQNLNLLRGKLTVSGLENVKTFQEACEAKMYEKKHLHVLELKFVSTYRDYDAFVDIDNLSSDALDYDAILGVLKGLKPPPNLKKLTITAYLGSRFPTWMVELSLLSRITLHRCDFCTEIPAFGLLPSLKALSLINCNGLRCIGPEFYGISTDDGRLHQYSNRIAFPKLEEIVVGIMPRLEEWDLGVYCHSTSRLQQEKVIVMPHLVNASIYSCEKLKMISGLAYSACEELEIDELEMKQLYVIGSNSNTPMFPNLKRLTISIMNNLENLETNEHDSSRNIVMMPQLQTLEISRAPKLRTLPHHLCRTLTKLSLSDCPKLTLGNSENASGPSSPFLFPRVEKLMLSGPAGVLYTSLWHFPSLKVLEMKSTPDGLKSLHFPRDTETQLQWLQYMKFDRCPFCAWGIAEEVKYLPGLQEICFDRCHRDHSQEVKDIESRTIICDYTMVLPYWHLISQNFKKGRWSKLTEGSSQSLCNEGP